MKRTATIRLFIGAVGAALALPLVVSSVIAPASAGTTPAMRATQLVDALNDYRIAQNMTPMSRSECLDVEAMKRAEAMAAGGPVGGNPAVECGFDAVNVTSTTGRYATSRVMDIWLQEPFDRTEIIESQRYTVVGAAVKRVSKKKKKKKSSFIYVVLYAEPGTGAAEVEDTTYSGFDPVQEQADLSDLAQAARRETGLGEFIADDCVQAWAEDTLSRWADEQTVTNEQVEALDSQCHTRGLRMVLTRCWASSEDAFADWKKQSWFTDALRNESLNTYATVVIFDETPHYALVLTSR